MPKQPDHAPAPPTVTLDGSPITIPQLEAVARRLASVELSSDARQRVDAARSVVERRLKSGDAHYGLNTGFGSLSRVRINPDQIREVQRNLIRSHAAGVGEPLSVETVRAMMLVLAASLARGRSGVRCSTIDLILQCLNRGLIPVVPSRGSVGASGDLAPLAHVALGLMGEGHAWHVGKTVPAMLAMRAAGITPLDPDAKEGLALINGTHLMCAAGALALADAQRVLETAISTAAMAIDACRATDRVLDERLHIARNQLGQQRVATRMRELLSGSEIGPSHREGDPRVQDPYCLRCAPQVLGAASDSLEWARSIIERELGAVTDNPLVFAEGDAILSGGNFHGMPLAIALDTARIALCHVAGIAERRVYWVLAATDPQNPVTPYLSTNPGLHSGLMIAQYTAAACCNEMQVLAHPASVHNIPTSAGIEDYNSMGATSALLLQQSVQLAARVVATELLVMAEAMEYQRPLKSGEGVEATHAAVRTLVPKLVADRPPSPDLEKIATLVLQGIDPGGRN